MKFRHFYLLLAFVLTLAIYQGCSSNNNPSSPSNPANPTNTPVPTSTATNSPTGTPTPSPTNSPTSTPTSTPSNSPTVTPTNTPTNTPTTTWTPCLTPGSFGNTGGIGPSTSFPSAGYCYFSDYTVPAGGSPKLRDIQVYLSAVGSTTVQAAVYTLTGSFPNNLVDATAQTSLNTGGSFGWVTLWLSGTAAVTPSTTYCICVYDVSGNLSVGSPTGGTNFGQAIITGFYNPFSATAGPSGMYSNSINVQVDYCK